jgi:hypothetical protein
MDEKFNAVELLFPRQMNSPEETNLRVRSCSTYTVQTKIWVKLSFGNHLMVFMMLLIHLLNLTNTNHINQCQIVIKNEI